MNFKTYLENVDMPQFVYHATFKAHVDSIGRLGLKPSNEVELVCYEGNEVGVYLADEPQFAVDFVECAENENIPEHWFDEIVVYQVDTNKIDKSKIGLDPHMRWSDDDVDHSQTWIYKGTISINALTYLGDDYSILVQWQWW
jgi:hypothetical protein